MSVYLLPTYIIYYNIRAPRSCTHRSPRQTGHDHIDRFVDKRIKNASNKFASGHYKKLLSRRKKKIHTFHRHDTGHY